jgi:hypothetical protein
MSNKLYQVLARTIQARQNCNIINPIPETREWFVKHSGHVCKLVSEHMPSGSGFDNGTKIDLDASHVNKIVLHTSYRHRAIDPDEWTEHIVTVTPDLASGFTLRVSGRNRNDIKDYIAETFAHALEQTIEQEKS